MNPFDAASPFDARYYFADAGFFPVLGQRIDSRHREEDAAAAAAAHGQ